MVPALGLSPVLAKPSDGFFVPAEDAPHLRTFMQWPVNRDVYPDRHFLELVQRAVARIANSIAEFEPVAMLADASHHGSARRHLSGSVELWPIPTDDLWCRDSGPLFVVDGGGGLAVRHIRFNGWGRKQTATNDGKIAERVADRLGVPLLKTKLVGEAGGVEQDGAGMLIAHESSWVNDNRNPGKTRLEVESLLLEAYGAERLLWSPGLAGQDITDYHIDALARFTAPGRTLINLPRSPDPLDPFHRAALQTSEVLKAEAMDIEVIPEPEVHRIAHEDFLTSYVNYYVCNGAVISAQFGDPETDALATAALERHYPGRAVIALNVDALGEIGGGIHCATQQMPRAEPA